MRPIRGNDLDPHSLPELRSEVFELLDHDVRTPDGAIKRLHGLLEELAVADPDATGRAVRLLREQSPAAS
ncbi:hypothetical protein [Actinomadura sp. 7K507]|uniref:hypothetical protein n=1 Tax=Actinomadura sp. 7K507 TaxID=2530365 RepID=UPI0010458212|nr:hypothetical protein [Actinomadura sp. 7K507]TDC94221.1 hypothetical protein E1285_08945 [Actinomadura sp. 7K507]